MFGWNHIEIKIFPDETVSYDENIYRLVKMRHAKRGDSFGFLYEHRQGNHSVHVTIEPT